MMTILRVLRGLISTNGVLLAVILAGLAAIWSYGHTQRAAGVTQEKARQEAIDHATHARAAAAAARSHSPAARGVLDPYTIEPGQ